MKKIDRKKIDEMTVSLDSTIKEAMKIIGQGEIGAAFIVEDETKKFLGVITDGDIRRAILSGAQLKTRVDSISKPVSVTATVGMKPEEISKMFGEKVRVIPVLDAESRIVDIAVYDQRVHLPVAAPSLGEKELEYVRDCIMSNWISSTGKYVNEFEDLFAEYCNSQHALATSSGTTALHLALLALGIGEGDEVIVPSFTFIATANAVSYTGAKPVFVDSEPRSWNIDPRLIEKAITSKTKAIIPVHLYGHPADMDPVLAIAKENHLAVIEDAAEAHGAEYKGKKVGSIGDVGVFSFYGNKIITTGEGGMVVTDDAAILEKMKVFRDHGMSASRRYWHHVLGYNYRMTNLQAAVGVAQVERIESIIRVKLDIAHRYEKQLKGISGIITPPQEDWARNVYWLYSILVNEEYGISRNELIKELQSLDIDTRPLFPPVHMQPIYNTGQRLKVSEELSEKGLSLPSSVGLQDAEIDRVCAAIETVYEKVQSKTYA